MLRYRRLTQKALAALLGMSEPTLSRELRRGRVKQLDQHLREYTSYSAEVAQLDYEQGISRRVPSIKLGHDHELASHVERRLAGISKDGKRTRRYSPATVIIELENKGWLFKAKICRRALYNFIAKDMLLHITQKDLPRGGHRKKRSYGSRALGDGLY